MGRTDLVWFDGVVLRVLAASCIVQLDDGDEVTIPLSQIRNGLHTVDEDADVTLGVPRWLAEDRDIEYRETRE